MDKYRVEKIEDDKGTFWAVVTIAHDGVVDIVEDYPTRAAARQACKQMEQEALQEAFAERKYQSAYDYACGYYD